MPLIGTFGAAAKGGFGRGSASFIEASGGTVTESGDYKIHTFTSSGTFTVDSAPPGLTVDYMVVAGGAGGGSTIAGGGGAGGLRYSYPNPIEGGQAVSETSYPISIGGGGGGGGGRGKGSNGSTSSGLGFSATGGGGGGGYGSRPANSGGSGGGYGSGPGGSDPPGF